MRRRLELSVRLDVSKVPLSMCPLSAPSDNHHEVAVVIYCTLAVAAAAVAVAVADLSQKHDFDSAEEMWKAWAAAP